MSNTTLHEYLAKKLEQKRKDHPSFRLMEIDDNLFPNGVVTFDTEKIEARDSNNKLKTVKEIVAKSWEKGSKNHLMIEGEGGMGKTVTLLSIPIKFTPFPIPAIYIPLHELTNSDNPIEYYIKRWVLNNKEDLYRQLLDLIDKPWNKGPQLMLLLDGFNEIAASNRKTIGENIEQWSKYPGIQIVTSSRYDIHTYIELSYVRSVIKLQPLSDKTVKNYLNRIGVSIPVNNAVTNLITNPLLLTLYVKTEIILRQRETEFSDFKEVRNAGTIVWNYLQCELWRYGKDEETARNAIIVMEFIAPFIAWNMQQKSLFVLEEKEFKKCLEDAYKLLEKHFNNPAVFPFHIQEAIQNVYGIPPLKLIKNLLEKHLCLFIKNKQQYRLMHQQFRDVLAAIHAINLSYLSGDTLPQEWNSHFDYYVMQFVVDLISEDEATMLWEQNRRATPAIEDATRNQLRLQGLLHKKNYTHLNFSCLDLRGISLYPYRISNSTIKLPTQPARMDKTKFSKKTFSPEEHEGPVHAIAVTPNGKFIVSGSRDRTIRIWDLLKGTPIGETIEGHNGPVFAVAVTPNGKRIVSGSWDKTIRVWDMVTGAPVGGRIEGHEWPVTTLAVTPNGKRIVSGSYDSTIRIWDMETGLPTVKPFEGHEGSVYAVAVTPDGKCIVSGSWDKTIRIWNIEKGTQIGKPIKGHKGQVHAIAVTPDGKYIVSGSDDFTIRIWDIKNGNPIGKPIEGHKDWIRTLKVTSDGKRIISGSYDGTIRVWDIKTGEPIGRPIHGHEGPVYAVAVTLDGKRIVNGSKGSTIQVWDIETGAPTIEGHEYAATAIAVTPDGKRIACGFFDSTIRVWDLEERALIGDPIEGPNKAVVAIAMTQSGKRIVSGYEDGSLRVWNVKSGNSVGKLIKGRHGSVNAVAVTPDGKRIVSGHGDNTLCVWDIKTGASIGKTIKWYEGTVTAIAVSPDGKCIVSGHEDYSLRVWDIITGKSIGNIEGCEGSVTAVAVSPDGKRIISVHDYGTMCIWDIETGDQIEEPIERQTISAYVGAVTMDGKYIVSCEDGGDISISDIETQENRTIHIHPLSFFGLDFSRADIADSELKETLRQNGAKV